MMEKPRTLALALLIGALALGTTAGVAVDRLVARPGACPTDQSRRHNGRDDRSSYLEWLTAQLELTVEQRSHVERTVDEHRTAVTALWREMRPEFEALKARLREDIRTVLDDQQREAYDALLAREAERRRRRKR